MTHVPEASLELYSLINITTGITNMQLRSLGYDFPKFDGGFDLNKITDHQEFKRLNSMYTLRLRLEQLVMLTAIPTSNKNVNMVHYPDCIKIVQKGKSFFQSDITPHFSAVVGRNVGFLEHHDTENSWLTTRDHFLCLSDIISQRFLLLLLSILGEQEVEKMIPPTELILKVFDWGDLILDRCGNEGFKAVKMWEALINGCIMSTTERYLDKNAFLNEMKAEFVKSIPGEECFLQERMQFLMEGILPLAATSDHYLSQVHGLYRIWGHPSIYGLYALAALQKVGRHRRLFDLQSIEIVRIKFREYLCLNYHAKEKKWPSMEIPEEDCYLFNCLRNNQALDTENPQYDNLRWADIQFKQTFTIPESFEFSDFVQDKSLSLTLPELITAIKTDGSLGHRRSVLLKWLESNPSKPSEFLNLISENGFGYENMLMGLYPKEREKNDARLFGLLPLIKRWFVAITEEVISRNILPLFPEITLTQPESANLTRYHQTTKSTTKRAEDDSDSVEVIVGLDFQKWNSNMREEETQPIMKDLDDLHGLTNVFTQGHSVFLHSVADGTITPELESIEIPQTDQGDEELRAFLLNSEYNLTTHEVDMIVREKLGSYVRLREGLGVYRGNIGGMEGMGQKKWTVITVVTLKHIAALCKARVNIIGQGDNQVLIITYQTNNQESIEVQHKKFMEQLTAFIATIGPPLNTDECWSTTVYFMYGKFPILNGKPISMCDKKLCRTFRLNNDMMLNLDSILGSISANAAAATKMMHSPAVPYWIGKFESIGAIFNYFRYPVYENDPPMSGKLSHLEFMIPVDKKPTYVKETPQTHLQFLLSPDKKLILSAAVSMIPSSLGGYSTLTMGELLLHGFHDPVTAAIVELKKLIKLRDMFYLPGFWECLISALNPKFSDHVKMELLLENPTCLNLNTCSRPKDLIRTLVFNHIFNMPEIKNELFRTMMSYSVHHQEELSAALFSMEPFRPKVLSAIFESTVISQAGKVLRKVDKTRTMLEVTAHAMISEAEGGRRRMNEDDSYLSFLDQFEMKRRRKLTLSEFFSLNDSRFLNSVLSVMNHYDPSEPNITECATKLAQEWRNESWKKEVFGVTVPHLKELFSFHPTTAVQYKDHPLSEFGNIQVTTSLLPDQHDFAFNSVGPSAPFFGSSTKDKVQYEGKQLAKKTPAILVKALQNLELVQWATPLESNMTKLIPF